MDNEQPVIRVAVTAGAGRVLQTSSGRQRSSFKPWAVKAMLPLLLLAAMDASRMASGQASDTGTISGRVKDSTGRVVVGASITLTSGAQHHVTKAKSNGQGEYVFNSVPIGVYTMTVTAPTFAAYSVTTSTWVRSRTWGSMPRWRWGRLTRR